MRLQIEKIEIDKMQVLKFLGYGRRQPHEVIQKKIDEEIEEAKELFEPHVFLKHFHIERIKDGEISLGNKLRIKSDYVVEELKHSSSVYLALYTIGDKVEAKINEYSNSNDMIRAMILDKIGIVALDSINHQIKEEIIRNNFPFKISSQLFPSQRDFDISNQRIIFDIFQEENEVITISKYYQLYPLKTVAVILGIGENEEKHDMCDRCSSKCFK